ncbi:MAG: CDP-alcohol phosphatidyltransferase family protein [Acidobacteria bacterium]|nr:CDP-alcohol phosphatidyltransferase family protein [Acidobacteriota bacterium]
MTFTGFIGFVFNFPLRAIIWTCVKLRISPNLLTLTGVLINVVAAWELAHGHFMSAGWWMVGANLFDYIDGKVASERDRVTEFGAFFDSVMDRFSDITLFIGLIAIYNEVGTGHKDYVLTTSMAMMFAIMTSYTRARAESLIEKCKVGFMERPERIVLFMIGAFTNRMAAVMWVILVLSVISVFDRIFLTWRDLKVGRNLEAVKAGTAPPPIPVTQPGSVKRAVTLPVRILWRGIFWTYERASWQYDVMVMLILAFVWLTPPGWLSDPMAPHGLGFLQWLARR